MIVYVCLVSLENQNVIGFKYQPINCYAFGVITSLAPQDPSHLSHPHVYPLLAQTPILW